MTGPRKMVTGDLSPLRYPGSKRSLFYKLHQIIQQNELNPNVLVEPFVGGGNIALHFLANSLVERVIVADKDPLVYSFWKVLSKQPQHLIDFVSNVKVDIPSFYMYKSFARHYHFHSTKKLAEACLFLNRTSFSGLLTHEAGPLGGKNQSSAYPIDCRFMRKTLIARIAAIAKYSHRIVVMEGDWNTTIPEALEWMSGKRRLNRPLFYLDPPFYNKAEHLYRCFFKPEDHVLLFDHLMDMKSDWVLSYDRTPEILAMYDNGHCRHVNVSFPYSLNSDSQRRANELLITPLSLP